MPPESDTLTSLVDRLETLSLPPVAAAEVVFAEFSQRRSRGESPTPEEYLARFPHLAPLLRGKFAGAATPSLGEVATDVGDSPGQAAFTFGGPPQIGDYTIERELGRGGMGVVYLARQGRLNRPVALKMVLGGGRASASALARFQAEAEAVARLQHPNIVQVYETGVHDGLPWYSLEYCPGGPLARKLAREPQAPSDAAALVEKLARAVACAHAAGVVHRDLKPANVLLTADDTPKVTDFGLAKQDGSSGGTLTGQVMGTPAYMAPEQARGDSRWVGPPADIHALGAILYECLTGRPPYQGPTPADTLVQVLQAEPVPPRRLQPLVPRDLEAVCLKCLQKSPGRRYASADDLADDLGRFLAGRPVAARRTGLVARVGRAVLRRPLAAGMWSVLLLLAAGGVGSAVWLAREARNAHEEAAGARRQAEEQAAMAAAAEARAREAAGKPARVPEPDRAAPADPKAALLARTARYALQLERARQAWREHDLRRADELLDACDPALRGWEFEHLRWLLARQGRPLFADPDRRELVESLTASADVRMAAAVVGGGLRVWEVDTGRQIFFQAGRSFRAALSGDGRRLAFRSDNRAEGVRVRDLVAGAEVARRPAADVSALALDHDGTRLAIAAEKRVLVVDLATGREVASTALGKSYCYSLSLAPDATRLAFADGDGRARVLDVVTGNELFASEGGRASGVALGGARLAVGGSDAGVWDLDAGRRLASQPSVAFPALADSGRLFVADAGWDVRGWDVGSGRLAFALTGRSCWSVSGVASNKTGLAVSTDGRRVLTGGHDGSVRVWDVGVPSAARVLGRPGAGSNGSDAAQIILTPDGRQALAVSAREIVRWDLADGGESLRVPAETPRQAILAVRPDGERYLAPGANPNEAVVRTLATREVVLTLKGHSSAVRAACFSADGKWVATGDDAGNVRVWDAESGESISSAAGHKGTVLCVAFDPTGRRVVSGGQDQTARIVEAATGKVLVTVKGHQNRVRGVAFSPDGKLVAGASQTAQVWDAETGKEAFRAEGDQFWMGSVAFTPDGRRLATTGGSGVVRVWDVATGLELATLPTDTRPVLP